MAFKEVRRYYTCFDALLVTSRSEPIFSQINIRVTLKHSSENLFSIKFIFVRNLTKGCEDIGNRSTVAKFEATMLLEFSTIVKITTPFQYKITKHRILTKHE